MKDRPDAIDKKLSRQAVSIRYLSLEIIRAMLSHESIYSNYNLAKTYEDMREKWKSGGDLNIAIKEKNIHKVMASEIISMGTFLIHNLRACSSKMLSELPIGAGNPMQTVLTLENELKHFKETACGTGDVPFADIGTALERECSRCHKWYSRLSLKKWHLSNEGEGICHQCYPEFSEEQEKRAGGGIFITLIVLFLLWYFLG